MTGLLVNRRAGFQPAFGRLSGLYISSSLNLASSLRGSPAGVAGQRPISANLPQDRWRSGQDVGPTIAKHLLTRQELVSQSTASRTCRSLLDGRAVIDRNLAVHVWSVLESHIRKADVRGLETVTRSFSPTVTLGPHLPVAQNILSGSARCTTLWFERRLGL